MIFNKINKELMNVRPSFLSRKTKEFKVEADNFKIEVTYEKIGKFDSSYVLNLKYNNYTHFYISKEPNELWDNLIDCINVIQKALIDPQNFKSTNIGQEFINRISCDEFIGKLLGRC